MCVDILNSSIKTQNQHGCLKTTILDHAHTGDSTAAIMVKLIILHWHQSLVATRDRVAWRHVAT